MTKKRIILYKMGASSTNKKAKEQEPKKATEQEPKKANEQEPKKSNEQEPKKIETKSENLQKEEEIEPDNYFYCLREREISYIEEMKEKKDKDIKNGTEQGGDKFYPLLRKIEVDLTKKETIVKEFLVLYIPSNYRKDTLKYKGSPAINHMISIIEEMDANKYILYTKINNSPKAIKNFECKQDPEIEYISYDSFLEFAVSPKDKEKNLVTIETCYKMKLDNKYGLYHFRFCVEYEKEENLKKSCFSFIFDDNYMACHIYKNEFDEISKYKLYSFNKGDIAVTFKDKRIKMNIEKELNKEYLSKFSPEEIKQINNSLNKIEFHYSFRHLIYQKVIHNIKDNKDYIKAYFIVFYPHEEGSSMGNASPPIKNKQPIIVKKFTINNLLVKKEKKYLGYEDEIEGDEDCKNEDENISEEESNEEANEEGIEKFNEGYYLSSHNQLEFYLMFSGIWGLYEFDCESNKNLDYFKLNCSHLGEVDEYKIYGASYKYEIILNGHKIKFPNENIKYSNKNDKIVFEGIIDGNKENFDEKKYVQLAKKYGREWYLDEKDEDRKMKNWAELRLNEFLPVKMKLVKK